MRTTEQKCSPKENHKNSTRAAERKFGVSEKLVRDCRKAEVTLNAMNKTK